MSKWETYKLVDLVTFSQGIQVPVEEQFLEKSNDMDRFIRIVDHTNPNEKPRFIRNVSDKYKVSKKDVVMIRYGWAGKVVRGISGFIANNMFKINVSNEEILNKEFLYYFLLQEKIYNYFKGVQSSTTMPAIRFSDFNNLYNSTRCSNTKRNCK
ncbi:restriction endonuclease subunit S [Necropsobacter rosorum]|uniref:restriction endonuclease subunit S n=1 Tax=Necropsobacter rosorum TaxID=908285 RepID=UPI003C7A8039